MGYETRFAEPPKLSSVQILGRYLHEYLRYILNRKSHRRMENRLIQQRRETTAECRAIERPGMKTLGYENGRQ